MNLREQFEKETGLHAKGFVIDGVHIVSEGEYEDSMIVGVFSTKKKADEYIEYQRVINKEELYISEMDYDLDEFVLPKFIWASRTLEVDGHEIFTYGIRVPDDYVEGSVYFFADYHEELSFGNWETRMVRLMYVPDREIMKQAVRAKVVMFIAREEN